MGRSWSFRHASIPKSEFQGKQARKKTLDSGGWFETRHGQPAFARGKHQGMSIQGVAQAAPDYLQWMLTIDLPQDTIKVIRSVMPNFGK
jgi:hypothetical protein